MQASFALKIDSKREKRVSLYLYYYKGVRFLKVRRMRRRSKTKWFRRLKTKKKCRLLLKDLFLEKLHSSTSMEDLESLKKVRSAAEGWRIKRNLVRFVNFILRNKRRTTETHQKNNDSYPLACGLSYLLLKK